MTKEEIKIESVKDFVNKLYEIQEQEEKKNKVVQWFFRGEKRLYSTSCSPNVFRNKPLRDNERDLILFAKRYYPSLFMECANDIQKLVIMQHFGLPTRLLDITSSPLVALYFACEDIMNDHPKANANKLNQPLENNKNNSEDESSAGRVFIGKLQTGNLDYEAEMYANALAVIVSNLSKDEMTAGRIDKVLKSYNVLKGSQFKNFKELKENFKGQEYIVYDSIKNNKRIANQCGQFILGSDIKNPKYKGFKSAFEEEIFVIPRVCKHDILKELDTMGINSATIYSDAEHQMKYLKYKAEQRYGFFIEKDEKRLVINK